MQSTNHVNVLDSASRATFEPTHRTEKKMRLLLRIKWRVFGYTYAVTRKGWGISHDENGTWTLGELPGVKDADFLTARTLYKNHGITIAYVAATN